jgi:PilX N-terminal
MSHFEYSLRSVASELAKRRKSVRNRQEQGIALVTTLLVLLLLSTMIVGIAWLITGDQKLGGNNSDRQLAFYGAEAGMESLTASLENLFDSNPSPNSAAINALMTTPGPPANIPNVQYIAPGSTTPGSGYQITFTPSPTNPNLPNSGVGTIPNGDNGAGLYAIMTPYTLTVTAKTATGSEVRLQRVVQTVSIPVFEFGYFSQMDLAFFAGPNFNFGGRVHTNGNLWLQEGSGSTLTMSQKVTAAGEIITKNLENGWVTTTNYDGTVNVTNGSGVSNLIVQAPQQSVLGNTNHYPAGTTIGPPVLGAYDTTFKAMANTVYNNNIGVAETGVKTLDVSIATPGIGGQPIDLIRRPQPSENTANNAKFVERYYGNPGLSLRILLSDYGPLGTCASSDISSTGTNPLPTLSAGAPVDLATLAWDTSSSGTAPPYNAAPGWLTGTGNVGKSIFPLPVSGASNAGTYSSVNGYWIQQYYPIVTGCIKIEYQNAASLGSWVDVTQEILEQGYTGRNINPQTGKNNVPAFTSYSLPLSGGVSVSALEGATSAASPQVAASGPVYSGAAVTTVGCQDPSPNAIIRLARVRDNPSTAASGNDYCGNNQGNTIGTWSTLSSRTGSTKDCVQTQNVTNCPSQHGTDYWPNVLYDPREAVTRDTALIDGSNNPQYTLAGAMYYVELDVANLMSWFAGTIGANGTKAVNTQGYAVYFSDRRAERQDNQTPPTSVGPSPILTGGFGYEDIVNGVADASGCPDTKLEQGEDVEGDYTAGVDATPVLKTYGGTPAFDNLATAPSIVKPIATLSGGVLQDNANCAGTKTTPFAVVQSGGVEHPQELRENAPLLFRRALKLVHGDTILPGTPPTPTCNSVPCGLTIASENPVYVQGCYNNPGQCNMTTSTSWSANSVATSVVTDALTFLSDDWNDVNSFTWPYGQYKATATPKWAVGNGGRNSVTTTYRLAAAAGKGIPFKQPTFASVGQDFGTDGGAHNFLRYIENWGGSTLYYEGSIVSLYYNHQAQGIYKCCNIVYNPPGRGYNFDTNFLTPSLLPPLTPMLRTVNTIGFTQMLLPTQ